MFFTYINQHFLNDVWCVFNSCGLFSKHFAWCVLLASLTCETVLHVWFRFDSWQCLRRKWKILASLQSSQKTPWGTQRFRYDRITSLSFILHSKPWCINNLIHHSSSYIFISVLPSSLIYSSLLSFRATLSYSISVLSCWKQRRRQNISMTDSLNMTAVSYMPWYSYKKRRDIFLPPSMLEIDVSQLKCKSCSLSEKVTPSFRK